MNEKTEEIDKILTQLLNSKYQKMKTDYERNTTEIIQKIASFDTLLTDNDNTIEPHVKESIRSAIVYKKNKYKHAKKQWEQLSDILLKVIKYEKNDKIIYYLKNYRDDFIKNIIPIINVEHISQVCNLKPTVNKIKTNFIYFYLHSQLSNHYDEKENKINISHEVLEKIKNIKTRFFAQCGGEIVYNNYNFMYKILTYNEFYNYEVSTSRQQRSEKDILMIKYIYDNNLLNLKEESNDDDLTIQSYKNLLNMQNIYVKNTINYIIKNLDIRMISNPEMIPTTQDTFNELYEEIKDKLPDKLYLFVLYNVKSYISAEHTIIDKILEDNKYDNDILREILNIPSINMDEYGGINFSPEGKYEYIIDKFCDYYGTENKGNMLLEFIINFYDSYKAQKVMIYKIMEKKIITIDDITEFRLSNENNILHYCVNQDRSPFDFFNTYIAIVIVTKLFDSPNKFGHTPGYYVNLYNKWQEFTEGFSNSAKFIAEQKEKQNIELKQSYGGDILKGDHYWLYTIKSTVRDYLANAMGPNDTLDDEEYDNISITQFNAIKEKYTDLNLFHNGMDYGGDFGVYFMLFYGSFKKFGKFLLTTSGEIMYIYHAKTLISKILMEFKILDLSFENMIYLNKGWSYGAISDTDDEDRTIMLENESIDIFFENIPEDYKNVKNELIIKWVIPCNIEYGMVTLTNKKFPFRGGSISRVIPYDLIHYKNKYIDNKKNYLSLIHG